MSDSKSEEVVAAQEIDLAEAAERLTGESRLARQRAAADFSRTAEADVSLVLPYVDSLIDALNRPEAITRWECLDVLAKVALCTSTNVDDAFAGAEAALFDEESGPVRLGAFKFLCVYGALSKENSEKAWSLLDEAIQCLHGDVEFQDMLVALTHFAGGDISETVKSGLRARLEFDVANGRGALQKRSAAVLAAIQ